MHYCWIKCIIIIIIIIINLAYPKYNFWVVVHHSFHKNSMQQKKNVNIDK